MPAGHILASPSDGEVAASVGSGAAPGAEQWCPLERPPGALSPPQGLQWGAHAWGADYLGPGGSGHSPTGGPRDSRGPMGLILIPPRVTGRLTRAGTQ